MERKALVIAGTRGGSGKTVITMGISRALLRRDISVASFKKGPDYIDPGWLSAASGLPCHTIDTYLLDEQSIHDVFYGSNPQCSIAIIEGNRGLFDGVDSRGTHSVAELSKSLEIPVVLVVDCTKATRTIAAVVRGCETLDTGIRLKGVILNNIAGERHRRIITDALQVYCVTPVIGSVPRMKELALPERHMGLTTSRETCNIDDLINSIADIIEKHVDMEKIISLSGDSDTKCARPSTAGVKSSNALFNTCASTPAAGLTLGVLYDDAFNFYYPENLAMLERLFPKVIYIDSLRTLRLPDLDALYIGGGFPEIYADSLSANGGLMRDIRASIDMGLPVYAECGGLIYLSGSVCVNNTEYPMAGVFPFRFDIARRPAAHGYVSCMVEDVNPFYDTGITVRGHEFRYAGIINAAECRTVPMVFHVERGTGIINGRDGALYKNTLATFCHTHALTRNVQWMASLASMAGRRTALARLKSS